MKIIRHNEADLGKNIQVNNMMLNVKMFHEF